ncbi:MAG TPA: hypothetical protein VFM46_06080 [Pseudomonadales bacterium]|nr:hypothetical protein [Pseudomonadales bacterium]
MAAVIFLLSFSNPLFATDWGVYAKIGLLGWEKSQRPEYSYRAVVVSDSQLAFQQTRVSAETVGEWPLAFALGVVSDQLYGVELGTTSYFRRGGFKGPPDKSFDYDYLLINRYFHFSFPDLTLVAGVGPMYWRTERFVDATTLMARPPWKRVTGQSGLAHVGADFLLGHALQVSHFAGLHFYRGFDADFPSQRLQVEYATYFW